MRSGVQFHFWIFPQEHEDESVDVSASQDVDVSETDDIVEIETAARSPSPAAETSASERMSKLSTIWLFSTSDHDDDGADDGGSPLETPPWQKTVESGESASRMMNELREVVMTHSSVEATASIGVSRSGCMKMTL